MCVYVYNSVCVVLILRDHRCVCVVVVVNKGCRHLAIKAAVGLASCFALSESGVNFAIAC